MESVVGDEVDPIVRKEAVDTLKIIRALRQPLNSPIPCDEADLDGSLSRIVFALLVQIPSDTGDKNAKAAFNAFLTDLPIRFGSKERLRELIKSSEDSLLVVAEREIGTHTCKIPSSRVAGPATLFRDPCIAAAASGLPFVSSFTTRTIVALGGAGNATNSAAQSLLSARLSIAGEPIDVAYDLADRGRIFDAFLRLGFRKSVLENVSDALKRGIGGEQERVIGAFAKTFVWPTEAGDVAITPLHPFAMHVEVSRRIAARTKSPMAGGLGHRIRTRVIHVGGAQPQNAGRINGALGGNHRCLISLPPTPLSRAAAAAYAQAHSDSVHFGRIGRTHPGLQRFVAVIRDKHANAATRLRLRRSLRTMTFVIVGPLLRLQEDARQGHRMAFTAIERLPGPYRALLLDAGGLGKDDLGTIVDALVTRLAASPHEIQFDDALRAVAAEAVTELLQRAFVGGIDA